MRIESLHVGERVRHPQYGLGTVQGLTLHAAEVKFDDGVVRSTAPATSGLQPAEARAELAGLEMPLEQLISQTVEAIADKLGLKRPDDLTHGLANRWRKGKLVLQPADPTVQSKELELEVFFHKIVMMRNNLRVLEQKVNASDKLDEAEKIEWQQYVTRCYGSMTSFNTLFKDKEDQF